MKTCTILFLLFLLRIGSCSLFAQSVTFKDAKTTAPESRSSSVLYEIELVVMDTIREEATLYLISNGLGTADNKDFRIIRGMVQARPLQQTLQPFIIEIYGDTIAEGNETILLTMSASTPTLIPAGKDAHLITLRDAPIKTEAEKESHNFRFLLGANFDLNDGLDANNFYKEISFFVPNALTKKRAARTAPPVLSNAEGEKKKTATESETKPDLPFGFYGGLYQTKSITFDSSGTRQLDFLYPVGVPTADSANLISEAYRQGSNSIFNNLGLYFAPFVKVNMLSEKDLTTYLGLHMEFIRRKIDQTYTYTLSRSDTSASKSIVDPELHRRPTFLTKRTMERYDSYWGLSLPINYTDRGYALHVRPILGMAVVSFPGSNLPQELKGDKELFYVVQFNLAAVKSGFNIGGEIRGFYGKKSAIATVQLSKILSIKKIGEAIVGSNSSD